MECLDADVPEDFERRATAPRAISYQTRIDNELPAIMECSQDDPFSFLVSDE
jgi:hypothetical protein